MRWIIGDVHGMLRPLQRLIDAVLASDPAAQLIFAGDYVNRGPDSHGTLDLLISLDNAKFIRGNHDDVFDLIINGHSYAQSVTNGDAKMAFQWFMDYGLDTTFHSYGADWDWLRETGRWPTVERIARLADSVPDAHKKFMAALPPIFETNDFFVLHGRWPAAESCYPPAISEILRTDPEIRQQLLWGRFSIEEIEAEKPWGKRGFFGHTPVHTYFNNPRRAPMEPLRGPKLTLVDTACALATWGRLTAYCVEEERFLQTSHFGELVKESA